MVIKLKTTKKPPINISKRFTLQDVEDLFSQTKNWKEFFESNEQKFWKDNLDIYKWCVYPLHYREGPFYRCLLHPMIMIDTGNKKENIKYENIHYSEFISHCIFYAPEEHKQYIIEKLKLNVDTATTTKSDDKKEKI